MSVDLNWVSSHLILLEAPFGYDPVTWFFDIFKHYLGFGSIREFYRHTKIGRFTSVFSQSGVIIPQTDKLEISNLSQLVTGLNTITFTVPARADSNDFGFLELIIGSKSADNKAIFSACFLPYRKRCWSPDYGNRAFSTKKACTKNKYETSEMSPRDQFHQSNIMGS